ncbi:3-hydroxyacyl-CoA dehydrogenase/enoyl-CoA hydratase family protein [Burkholderiaceae bacterium]|nr:3-hydroxyacyl-CoA dehydrogenase/enoyl-CoA hydratase family protein [Burkholderiaceae bacterium]
MHSFHIRRVAVLGAGVMGAQIAAHLVNARIPVTLFDLPTEEGHDPSAIARKAIAGLSKMKPAPLGRAADASLIQAANYNDDLAALGACDLVIEAIAERLDWKHGLYEKIAPHLSAHAILASNTSGLSISALGAPLPDELASRFCGVHFFNPPRYMALVELIATPRTDPRVVDQLESFVTTSLGKSAIRAKDTPNFIANRIGSAGLLSTFVEAERYGLTCDVVDDLTGKSLGRASSGTFRTADVVGLDTLGHVIHTLQTQLDASKDPFYPHFETPPALKRLIEKGHLGQKVKKGFYKKVGRDFLRYDLASDDYVPGGNKADAVYNRMLKRAPAERLRLLRESSGAEGQFLWAILRNGFHYAALHLAQIAHTARDVDACMRLGFAHKQGPFELWQSAGWQQVAEWVQADIDAGKALCGTPLPDWVFNGPVADAGGVYTPEGSWNPETGAFERPHVLPVHARQLFPDTFFGDGATPYLSAGQTVFEDESIRLWTHDDHAEVLIASIKTKMQAISPQVAEGLQRGVRLAEAAYAGMVIWSGGKLFSAGADLQAMLPGFMIGGLDAIDAVEHELQKLMLAIRYAHVPVVSAVSGLTLGGGCELAVYSAKRVVAHESYIGLVEVGVGLVPGAGGLTYIARRAAENARLATGTDLLPFLTEGFTAAAMAKVGTSALESRDLGYVLDSDPIVMNASEVLGVALNEVKAMSAAGYRAPMARHFKVAGRTGVATILGQLINMRDGGFISEHDFRIGKEIAQVVCGGEVDANTEVSEAYLMTLERRAFGQLLASSKTQARIMGMLNTGKPLRN